MAAKPKVHHCHCLGVGLFFISGYKTLFLSLYKTTFWDLSFFFFFFLERTQSNSHWSGWKYSHWLKWVRTISMRDGEVLSLDEGILPSGGCCSRYKYKSQEKKKILVDEGFANFCPHFWVCSSSHGRGRVFPELCWWGLHWLSHQKGLPIKLSTTPLVRTDFQPTPKRPPQKGHSSFIPALEVLWGFAGPHQV